jgi:hypothetical protein
MHRPDWKEAYERAYNDLLIEHPELSDNDLDKLASEEADDHIASWEDMMIDRERDEQMMDEGGGSQTKKPKDERIM